MSDNIDWGNLPYDHAGRWQKNMDSVMNPGTKVTWPQLIVEFVVYWRSKYIDSYKTIQRGANWYRSIAREVRNLNQQACVLCNYFPHPTDEPLVLLAIKNWFRDRRVMKIGRYRKVRVTSDGKINITQDEKDIVYGIKAELDKLIKQRSVFINVKPQEVKTDIKFRTNNNLQKNTNLRSLDL